MKAPWSEIGLPARIESKIQSAVGSDCWLWMAAKNKKGYGVYGVDGVTKKAHRYVYELLIGKIPDGMCLLHSCDTPSCVNPHHLKPGTREENNLDMMRKGRHVKGGTHCGERGRYERGERHHGARLNHQVVLEMRRAKAGGESFSSLSKRYGVSIGHTFRIVKGLAWKHVD